MSANFLFGKWLSTPEKGEEVVISGMAGRFPESDNLAQFNGHLIHKEDMVNENCKGRWDGDVCLIKSGGRIPEITRFDCGFFGLHYRQANYMDPMVRILLETAIEAIMDAGMNPKELEGSKTAVIVASIGSDHGSITFREIKDPQMFAITGFARCCAASRVSYFLKLKGPSYSIDTACSSSMNCLEHALKYLRSGDCDNVIVACTNLTIHPWGTNNAFRLGVLSRQGIPRVFDDKADGYVRTEAVGCLFLQKAKHARRVYGTIIHSKINDDGYKAEGITFPSARDQGALMKEVYEESGLDVDEISYFEAHATGTKVGDPQELEAIDMAIGKKRSKPLWIGSVKSNIGHTEPSSGFCSVCKVLLAFETGAVSPNIHFENPRPDIEAFSAKRFQVVTENVPLMEEDALVGINNFGFGGNNVHVALRRFPKRKSCTNVNGLKLERIVCVSGRTEEAVRSLIKDIQKNYEDVEYIALLQHAFGSNMCSHFYKGYVVLTKKDASIESVKFCQKLDRTALNLAFGDFDKCYKNVGRSFLKFPVFYDTLTKLNNYITDFNIFESIRTDLIDDCKDQIVGFCVEIGILETMRVLGLQPENVYGISPLGQLVAVYSNNQMAIENILDILLKGYNKGEKFEFVFNSIREIYTISNSALIRKGFVKFSNDSEFSKGSKLRLWFLKLLGSLYQEGHELKLFNLYPKIQFPVSRSTPMISPSILWDHSKPWMTYRHNPLLETKAEEKTFIMECQMDEDKYILGHVIDDRNLFPAAGFLWLAWNTLAQSRDFLAHDISVVFENCKFTRAVNIPSSGKLTLTVTIQRGSGLFEVIHDDAAAVTGRIYIGNNPEPGEFSEKTLFSVDDPELGLNHNEIYRELNLRGYNYSGLFRSVRKCNANASKGVIKWENNWITFLDNMFQLQILAHDTRLLYVPVGIERLSIDPVAHLKIVGKLGEETLIPVTFCKTTNIIRTEAIQVRGLVPSSIQRRKHLNEPVLEKYMFVPNVTNLDIRDGLRVILQVIMENSQTVVVNAIENLEDGAKPLLPIIGEILNDVPLIKSDLTISTKQDIEPTYAVGVENVILTSNSKLLLLIGAKVLFLSQCKESLKEDGFILSREDHDFDPSYWDQTDLTLLLAITTENEKLILLRRNVENPKEINVVRITSENFDWISDLQELIQAGARVVVFSQNETHSGILGLMNCLKREKNGNSIQCFFIMDSDAPNFDLEQPLYKKQLIKNCVFNIYKNSTWGTYRHLLLDDIKQELREHAFINILDKGNLKSLTWSEGPLYYDGEHHLSKDETLVIPYFCALNFRDVLSATGRINVDAYITSRTMQQYALGFEFAGRTLKGKRVMGFGIGGQLASLVKAGYYFLFDVPQNWSLEDAATIPVVYATLVYGFMLRTNCLQPGKSILIHCGAGGVGMAAIHMAHYYNMEVFTTVGTQEKRDFVMKQYPQLKASQVGNSRDTSFVSMIKKATNGRGVDVVLNSLAEEKLIASIRCLADGGAFIEIGKFDLLRNSPLHLLLMAKEASFHGVMLSNCLNGNIRMADELIEYVHQGIRSGLIAPIPRTVFPENKIESAFRYMSTGKHVGKVIVRLREEEQQEISIPTRKLYRVNPRFFCNPDKVHIIIGGLGGVGLELADWLILREAKTLLISTRNGITSSYQQQRINIWASYGVKVVVSTADITTKNGCEELIQEARNLGIIEGIFNLAVVLKDTAFENQIQECFNIAFGPKARAVQYLDEITRQRCPYLRYFVVFSSVSCGRGNPGQTNYAMANSVMERICEKRKEEGFPALAIQWGAIGDVGLVSKMQNELKILEISGTLQQSISNCISLMDRFMNQDHSIVSSMIVAEKKRQIGSENALEAVAHVLGIKDPNLVASTIPLSEFGMDSLTRSEIYQILEKDFEIIINPEDMKNLTFEKLRLLEAAKSGAYNTLDQKSTLAMAKFLNFMPNAETAHLPMLEMLSNNNNIGENEHLVFVLPGTEGILSYLENITQRIDAKVQGLQYGYKYPLTVSETANALLPHIEEKLGNHKTFYILAYSFGVLVSLEIAYILESKGYHGHIFAIDGSPAYVSGSVKQLSSPENEDAFQISVILLILKQILPIDVVEANQDKIINARSDEERIDIAAKLTKRSESPNYEFEKMMFKAVLSRYQATLSYDYPHENKLKSFVKLYRVSQPMIKDMDNDYGLSRLVEKEVEVVEFDADHISVVKEVSIADDINTVLAKSTTIYLEI